MCTQSTYVKEVHCLEVGILQLYRTWIERPEEYQSDLGGPRWNALSYLKSSKTAILNTFLRIAVKIIVTEGMDSMSSESPLCCRLHQRSFRSKNSQRELGLQNTILECVAQRLNRLLPKV